MDRIFANTDEIQKTAQTISNYNNTIQNRYDMVINSVKKVTNNWSGKASDTAQSRYRIIHRCYYEGTENTRYEVINNYVKALNEAVANGYNQTEKLNTKLADAFK